MEIEKNKTMFAHVEEWRRSGKSIRDYSDSIGVSTGKFEYWVKKVRNTTNAKMRQPEFVEIGTSGKGLNCGQTQWPSPANPQIELTLPGGLCIKIYR